MYLFPINKIRPAESILIYGYGMIGKSLAEQVAKSGYCIVLAFLDANPTKAVDAKLPVLPPEKVRDFDGIRVLLAAKEKSVREEMSRNLIRLGIEEKRIIKDGIISFFQQEVAKEICGTDGEILRILITGGGGLGDDLLALPAVERIRELYGKNTVLIGISKYKGLFENRTSVFDEVLDTEDVAVRLSMSKYDFDAFISFHHIPRVIYWAPEKVKRIAPELHVFCQKYITFDEKRKLERDSFLFIYRMARLYTKNRIDVTDFFGDLGKLSRHIFLSWSTDSQTVLEKFGLSGKCYAVLNRDSSINASSYNPKLWPAEYYGTLARLLKVRFPAMTIVLIGRRALAGKIDGIDMDLSGATTLNELKVILKFSEVLVSCEGGLVHLNHFLYNRSVVIFGPTDEAYFGHKEDAACVARDCGCPCNYITSDWMKGCIRNFTPARCMARVTPEIVLGKASEIIRSHSFSYGVRRLNREDVPGIIASGRNEDKGILQIDGQDDDRRADRNWMNYPAYEGCFDIIFISAGDFTDPYAVLHEMVRILKVGGELILPVSMLACSPDLAAIPDGRGELVMLKKESAGDLV